MLHNSLKAPCHSYPGIVFLRLDALNARAIWLFRPFTTHESPSLSDPSPDSSPDSLSESSSDSSAESSSVSSSDSSSDLMEPGED